MVVWLSFSATERRLEELRWFVHLFLTVLKTTRNGGKGLRDGGKWLRLRPFPCVLLRAYFASRYCPASAPACSAQQDWGACESQPGTGLGKKQPPSSPQQAGVVQPETMCWQWLSRSIYSLTWSFLPAQSERRRKKDYFLFKIGVFGEVVLNQSEFEVLTLNLFSACFPTQVIAASLLLGIHSADKERGCKQV